MLNKSGNKDSFITDNTNWKDMEFFGFDQLKVDSAKDISREMGDSKTSTSSAFSSENNGESNIIFDIDQNMPKDFIQKKRNRKIGRKIIKNLKK